MCVLDHSRVIAAARRVPAMPEPACPHCHEPMKRAFTIAPSEGLPEMLVLYCAPCKHVETIAATSPAPNAQSTSRLS